MSKFDIDNFPTSETGKRMLKRVSPIYDSSYVAKWLYQVMGLEMDEAAAIIKSLREQEFTQTVTWGIEYQEHKYSILPDDSLTLEERRARLYRKKTEKFPLNPRRAELYIKNGWGMDVDIDETYAPGILKLSMLSKTTESIVEMLKDFRRIKPSHLSLLLEWSREIQAYPIGIATATINEGVQTISIRHPPNEEFRFGPKVFIGDAGVQRIEAGVNTLKAESKEALWLSSQDHGLTVIGADLSDLPEPMKDILYSSRAAPRVGMSIFETGASSISISRPTEAETPMGAGFFIGNTGTRRILPESPQGASNILDLGIVVTFSGKTTIPANMSDLVPPDVPPPDVRIGIDVVERKTGLDIIVPALPENVSAGMVASLMLVNAGRSVIPADLDDIEPSRIWTNAVGRIHVGLAQI